MIEAQSGLLRMLQKALLIFYDFLTLFLSCCPSWQVATEIFKEVRGSTVHALSGVASTRGWFWARVASTRGWFWPGSQG